MTEDTPETGNVKALEQTNAKRIAAANLAQCTIFIHPSGSSGQLGLPPTEFGINIIEDSLIALGITGKDIAILDFREGKYVPMVDDTLSIKKMFEFLRAEQDWDYITLTEDGVKKFADAGISHPVVNAYRGKPPLTGRGQG